MSGSANLERLLPTLFEFLSGEAPGHASEGSSSSGSSAYLTRHAGERAPPSQACLASYKRWRRCIGVWRKVIGNDSLLLTLLLHAGCLWTPDYAALHRARREIAARAQRPRRDGTARHVGAESDALHADGTSAREADASLMEWVAATTTATTGALAGPVPQPAVRRRGRRGVNNAAEAAAQSAAALAAAAELHAALAAACPASVWALHVLHFLRVEEVYAVPTAPGDGAHGADAALASSHASTSRGTRSSDDDASSSSSNASATDTDSADSASSISDDKGGDGTSAGGRGGGRRGSGGAGSGRGAKRARTAVRRRGLAHDDVRGSRTQRKRHRAQDSDDDATAASPPSSARQWSASSALLLGVSGGEKSWTSPAARSAVPGVLLERELHRRRTAHTLSSHNCEDPSDGAGSDAALRAEATVSAERTHDLLQRALVSLVSEEEPLVQRVASALVDEWLRLMSAEPQPAHYAGKDMKEQTDVKEEEKGSSAAAPLSRATGGPLSSDEAAAELGDAVREARDYWLSCALKLVAYLDGVHSALREENSHIAAVLARQGIVPHHAEDIFSKSIPAIFNCVLVEETLSSAAAATHATPLPALAATAPPPLQLRMPPPVLLLPFHLLAQGSQLGVWVPASSGAPCTRSGARALGDFTACTVESYGLHCSTGQHASASKARRQGRRLGFAVRCAEPEARLDASTVAALDLALPREAAAEAASESSPVRWWACTLPRTCGVARVDLYVARTLVMLPIPAQSTLGSAAAAHPTRAAAGASNGSSETAPTAAAAATRTSAPQAGGAGASPATGAAAEDGRRGRGRVARRRTAEEVQVRRRQPLLYHAMHPHLRAPSLNSGAASTAAVPAVGAAAELVLLYGIARGEEASLLRQIGFTVRTGSHHGLGRSGGTAGGAGLGSSARRASPNASGAGAAPAGVGFNGRLTMARDALGTTLEGLYLVARRVLALQGLFASPPAVATAATRSEGTGKGPRDARDPGRAAGFSAKGTAARADVGHGGLAGDAAHVSALAECEALGTAAATLVLSCLVLSHSLVDELLEQPSLVLWSAELASFVLDVSLLLPRPVPRLMKADGIALALLLQPAQSLLLLVGLAATLVTREAHLDASSSRAGAAGRGRAPGAGGGALPAEETWHPWWSIFRAAVLRDAELPSRLYPGVWAIAENAEAALAAVAAHASSAGRPLGCNGGAGGALASPASASGRGGRRGLAAAGGARRVLSLAPPAAAAPAAGGPRPYRRLHVGAAVSTLSAAAAASTPSYDGRSAETGGEVPRCLCGPAVVRHGEAGAPEVPAGVGEWLRVVPGTDVALLEAHTVPRPLRLLSHTTLTASMPRLTSAVASALWLALEAEGMRWPLSGSVAGQ